MNGSWVFSLITLLYCVFHLIALTLALTFWRRHPKVCGLVLAGAILNLSAMSTRLFLPMMRFHDPMGFAFIHLGIGLVNICGSSLYLAAIFTGRRPNRSRLDEYDDDDDDWNQPTPKSAPRSTWFREHES